MVGSLTSVVSAKPFLRIPIPEVDFTRKTCCQAHTGRTREKSDSETLASKDLHFTFD
jgi:hypothetical protein